MAETSELKNLLEDVYTRYNHRSFVHPDPLEFLYRYENTRDRELAGLVASSLAYGRVGQILKSIEKVLDILGESPSEYLQGVKPIELREKLSGFRHRFTPGEEMAEFLLSLRTLQKEYGLLGNCLGQLVRKTQYLEALDLFVEMVLSPMGSSYLLPRPSRGSACKRLHLFMRWMVRKDEVDPGGWDMINQDQLIVPVDVHMHRAGKCIGFTHRKTADGKTANEITEGFRKISPHDPAKYDFALTRFGIQNHTECSLFRKLFS